MSNYKILQSFIDEKDYRDEWVSPELREFVYQLGVDNLKERRRLSQRLLRAVRKLGHRKNATPIQSEKELE